MTAPNAELAYRVLDHIDAHPKEWRQSAWACGSAYCFGGWAIILAGSRLEWDDVSGLTIVTASPDQDLVGRLADEAAMWVLGLDEGEDELGGEWLFDPANDREDLGRLVAEIFGPRPAVTE